MSDAFDMIERMLDIQDDDIDKANSRAAINSTSSESSRERVYWGELMMRLRVEAEARVAVQKAKA